MKFQQQYKNLLVYLVLLLLFHDIVEAKGKLIELDLIKQSQMPSNMDSEYQDIYSENTRWKSQNTNNESFYKEISHKYGKQKEQHEWGMDSDMSGDLKNSPLNKNPVSYLKNIENNQYIVRVFIGSNQQPIPLLLDTGSSYTLVQGEACKKCQPDHMEDDLFNCSESQTCAYISKTEYELNYVQGTAFGNLVSDQVCLQKGFVSCTNQDFRFLDIFNTTSSMRFIRAEGIMGAGLQKKDPSINFIMKLFQNGSISEPSFSLYISDENTDRRNQRDVSKLILGGIDQKYAAEGAKLITHSVAKNDQWMLNLDSVFFNDKSVSQQSKYALIDSGTSNLVLPREDYNFLLKQLNTEFGLICKSNSNIYITCSCTTGDISKFPDIKIRFGGVDQDYTLSPSDYIIQNNHLCNMQISYYTCTDSSWILGDVFLRKYMAYFNLEKETIGLVLSNKKSLEGREFLKDVMIILECFLGSLFLGILVIYFIRMISGLKNAKDEDLNFN